MSAEKVGMSIRFSGRDDGKCHDIPEWCYADVSDAVRPFLGFMSASYDGKAHEDAGRDERVLTYVGEAPMGYIDMLTNVGDDTSPGGLLEYLAGDMGANIEVHAVFDGPPSQIVERGWDTDGRCVYDRVTDYEIVSLADDKGAFEDACRRHLGDESVTAADSSIERHKMWFDDGEELTFMDGEVEVGGFDTLVVDMGYDWRL